MGSRPLGTDPFNSDTDGDGANDFNEAFVDGTDPTRAPPPIGEDADDDGLSDALEADIGTDPNAPDTDGDGLPDRAEFSFSGTDPLNPDTDGDGANDSQDSHPHNPMFQ